MSLVNLPVNTQSPGPLRGSWLKRRPDSESDDDEEGTSAKVPRYSWYVTLESESPQPTDEDDESVYSIQDKETDYVADTSDTSTHTWVSSSDGGDLSLHVEYEVASLSEDPNPFDNNASSSDVSDIVAMGVLTFCDSDLGLADDDSNDSRSSVDSEIGTADYWTCVQCNAKNNNPLFRYCEKCYQIRKNFFPPRPKWKKSRRQIDSRKGSPHEHQSEDVIQQELISVDSGLGSSQDTKSSLVMDSGSIVTIANEPTPAIPTLSSFSNRDRVKRSTENESFRYDGRNVDKAADDAYREPGNKLCITCTAAPKNGAFVHGAVTHICCCYPCAVKVWVKTKRCPICNRKVTNVLKAFYT